MDYKGKRFDTIDDIFENDSPGGAFCYDTDENNKIIAMFGITPNGYHFRICFKPGGWNFDGNIENPTITPSIRVSNQQELWHGFLTNGIFKSV